LNIRKHAVRVLGASLATSAVLAMAACATASNGGPSGSSSTAPLADPAAALTAAVGKLGGVGYDMTLTTGEGINGTGSIDPTTHSAAVTAKGEVQGVSVNIGATEIGTDLYAKIDLGPMTSTLGLDPTKWYQLDPTKVTGEQALPFDLSKPDALGIGGLLTGVSDLKSTDSTHITGTVDLTKATGPAAPSSADATGETAVPFTVTLDDQGRIIEVKVEADASHKTLGQDIQFSHYGSPTAITKPDGAIPAPDSVYQFLNS
jgi:hypothetical protein